MECPKENRLPIIDMIKAKAEEKFYAEKIIDALENDGFLYIDGVDVDFEKLYQACQWFFTLSPEKKYQISRRPYNPDSKNYYRGYWPVVKGEASRKEAYETCPDFDKKQDSRISEDNWMYEQVPWPEEDGAFPFKEFMLDYYQKMHDTSMKILRLISIGLGLAENAFEEHFTKMPLSTLRLIHYSTWEDSGETPPQNAYAEDGRLITTPDHADTTFLTLLHTFDFDGLEMLDKDGNWQAVPCRPQGFVMNIGDTFSRMMNGRFKATRHRVMDINKERFSVPYFLEPSFYADVGINWITTWTDKENFVSEPYGPWMISVMKYVKKYAEARFLPEFEYNLESRPVSFRHVNQPPMAPSGTWVHTS